MMWEDSEVFFEEMVAIAETLSVDYEQTFALLGTTLIKKNKQLEATI